MTIFKLLWERNYHSGGSIPEVSGNQDGSLDSSWSLKARGTATILNYGDDYHYYTMYMLDQTIILEVSGIYEIIQCCPN